MPARPEERRLKAPRPAGEAEPRVQQVLVVLVLPGVVDVGEGQGRKHHVEGAMVADDAVGLARLHDAVQPLHALAPAEDGNGGPEDPVLVHVSRTRRRGSARTRHPGEAVVVNPVRTQVHQPDDAGGQVVGEAARAQRGVEHVVPFRRRIGMTSTGITSHSLPTMTGKRGGRPAGEWEALPWPRQSRGARMDSRCGRGPRQSAREARAEHGRFQFSASRARDEPVPDD